MSERLWLERSYDQALRLECGLDEKMNLTESDEQAMQIKSLRYGEISIPVDPEDESFNEKEFEYSDQFGLREKSN